MDSMVIRFGTLHDRPGEEPRRDGVLVIEGGRVSGVDVPEPANATRLEAECVVPGLVNAHAHLECDGGPNIVEHFTGTTPTRRALVAAANARRTLAAGITSIRDVGAPTGSRSRYGTRSRAARYPARTSWRRATSSARPGGTARSRAHGRRRGQGRPGAARRRS